MRTLWTEPKEVVDMERMELLVGANRRQSGFAMRAHGLGGESIQANDQHPGHARANIRYSALNYGGSQ